MWKVLHEWKRIVLWCRLQSSNFATFALTVVEFELNAGQMFVLAQAEFGGCVLLNIQAILWKRTKIERLRM